MATEILVNDGGAPSRIIPMVCTAAVTAGDALGADHGGTDAAAKCQKLDSGATERHFIGVALTDAATGALVNVVTGKGIVVRINCADLDGGVPLMASSTAGQLAVFTDGTALQQSGPCAITMEDGGGTAGLKKCLTI
tara:strand:- start:1890 stop:2300 length:411 start_codon:yes stop_codon:yes gene_type:complete